MTLLPNSHTVIFTLPYWLHRSPYSVWEGISQGHKNQVIRITADNFWSWLPCNHGTLRTHISKTKGCSYGDYEIQGSIDSIKHGMVDCYRNGPQRTPTPWTHAFHSFLSHWLWAQLCCLFWPMGCGPCDASNGVKSKCTLRLALPCFWGFFLCHVNKPKLALWRLDGHMEREPASPAIIVKAQQHKWAQPTALRAKTSCPSRAQSKSLTHALASKWIVVLSH